MIEFAVRNKISLVKRIYVLLRKITYSTIFWINEQLILKL